MMISVTVAMVVMNQELVHVQTQGKIWSLDYSLQTSPGKVEKKFQRGKWVGKLGKLS